MESKRNHSIKKLFHKCLLNFFFPSEANGSDVGEWPLCSLIIKVTFHITFQMDTMNLCNIFSEKRLDSSIGFKGKWGFTWRIFHYDLFWLCFFFPCTNIKAPTTPNLNIAFSPRCLSAYKDLSIRAWLQSLFVNTKTSYRNSRCLLPEADSLTA